MKKPVEYQVQITCVVAANSDKRLAKLLDRMLAAGGDDVLVWSPNVYAWREMEAK